MARRPMLSGPFAGAPGFGSALVGFAPAGTGPGAVAIDPATHTLYVSDGFSYSGNGPGGDTVSVIDARRCNAQDLSRCPGPWPTITLGGGTADGPSGIAIDVQNDTLYVSNIGVRHRLGDQRGDVQRDGERRMRSDPGLGLGRRQPGGSVRDPDNHTVYVPDDGDTSVSMIDSATCNATNTAGCPYASPPRLTSAPTRPARRPILLPTRCMCRRSAPRTAGRCSTRHVQRDCAERLRDPGHADRRPEWTQ